MKELWGADKLEAELEAARDDLRGLEKNIRKILGRDVPEGENGIAPLNARLPQKRPLQEDRRRVNADFPNNNEFGAKRRWQGGTNAEPKTVFSRLSARVPSTADDSGDEDDNAFKPAVSSRVIATPREIPSRQEVIRRESVDERSRQRNRRMFGALLGTLQKFRQEETKLKAKEDKKAEVEARVEEAKQREKEQLKKERQQLFLTRKQRQAQVKTLEVKLARSKQYQEWRSAQIPLLNYIKTKTAPYIYYLPKRPTPETDTLLQESSKELKAEIDRREKALVEDLERIQSQGTFGRNQNERNRSMSDNLDQSITEEPEGEENHNPKPEKNGDIEMTDNTRKSNRASNYEEHKKQGEHEGNAKNEKMDKEPKRQSGSDKLKSDTKRKRKYRKRRTDFDAERESDSDEEKEADRSDSDKEKLVDSVKGKQTDSHKGKEADSYKEKEADSYKEKEAYINKNREADSDKDKETDSDKEKLNSKKNKNAESDQEKDSESDKEKEVESDKERETESDKERELDFNKEKKAESNEEIGAGFDKEREAEFDKEREPESDKEKISHYNEEHSIVSLQEEQVDDNKSEEYND